MADKLDEVVSAVLGDFCVGKAQLAERLRSLCRSAGAVLHTLASGRVNAVRALQVDCLQGGGGSLPQALRDMPAITDTPFPGKKLSPKDDFILRVLR